METLKVKRLQFDTLFPDLDIISSALDKTSPGNHIDKINWADFPYKPVVDFSAGYTEKEFLLKYYVTEDCFKAEMTETNQPVYEDSCVEIFVSPADDGIYYNLEFNGIGTCLMGAGTGRHNRTRFSPEIIASIRRESSAGREPVAEREGTYSWSITVAIPYKIFIHHNIKDPEGLSFRVNFYKCGDRLKRPHYVTWSHVKTEKPDFHRPEYFGILKFI